MNLCTRCACNGASNSHGIQMKYIIAPSYIGARKRKERKNIRAGGLNLPLIKENSKDFCVPSL